MINDIIKFNIIYYYNYFCINILFLFCIFKLIFYVLIIKKFNLKFLKSLSFNKEKVIIIKLFLRKLKFGVFFYKIFNFF